MYYHFEPTFKEDLCFILGHGYLPSNNLKPSEKHQIFEDMVKKQKEFASEIYIQRCKEKDL
jgi:hypothetical protein